jgi:hypothetical protein
VSEYYDSKTLVKRINRGKLSRRVVADPELPRLLIKFAPDDILTTGAMIQCRIRELRGEEGLAP